MPSEVREASPDQAELLRDLFAAGLLIESGVPGVYGHGEAFERVRERLERRVSAEAVEQGAIKLQFPPVVPTREVEAAGYVGNFPHLVGSIFSFEGTEADAQIQAERAAVHEDWSEFQEQTDVTLLPSACYPVYPAIARRGRLEPGGVCVDVGAAWVYRHEPSLDPARRQIFRMHELVRIGEPDAVLDWRAESAQSGVDLLRGFGLDANLDNANDPFFGRRGRMLAKNQRDQDLKLELLIQIAGPEPTACASFNHHMDHFGSTWGIELSDGAVAHTACLGFGQERIVLALFSTHGLDPREWSPEIRAQLWD